MTLKSLIEQYLATDSIRLSESLENQIISLIDEHVKQQFEIYKKWDMLVGDTDYDGYDSEKGTWIFKTCLPDEVYLEHIVYYGACGCEGFSKYFKYNEIDNFDWKAFEEKVKANCIKQLTAQHKSLIDKADKISKQIEELQKNET